MIVNIFYNNISLLSKKQLRFWLTRLTFIDSFFAAFFTNSGKKRNSVILIVKETWKADFIY